MPQKRRCPNATALPALVDGLHAAALDGGSRAWAGALERVADAFGAGSAYLQPYGGGSTWGPGAPIAVRVDPAWAHSYVEYYGRLDPVLPAVLPKMAPGTTVTGRHAIEPAALWRTEYGHDWCKPQGMAETALGLLSRDESDPHGGWGLLVLSRGHGSEPFGAGDLRRVSALLPHLRRAVAVGLRLGVAIAERDALAAALDGLGARGAMLADVRGRVVFANRAAEAFLADPRCPLARAADGALRASPWMDARLDADLRRLLASGAGTVGRATRAGGALTLPAFPAVTPPARPAVLLKTVPIGDGRTGAAVLVLLDDLGCAEGPTGTAPRLYGLTPAEARVAALVAAKGLGVKGLARELGVSPNTARTHLQRVFEKTDTHRLAELVTRLRDNSPG